MYCFCPSAFLIREKSLVGSDGKRRSDPSTAKRRYPRKVIVGIADETKSLNIISTALERILLRCWTNAEAVAVLGVYPNQSYNSFERLPPPMPISISSIVCSGSFLFLEKSFPGTFTHASKFAAVFFIAWNNADRTRSGYDFLFTWKASLKNVIIFKAKPSIFIDLSSVFVKNIIFICPPVLKQKRSTTIISDRAFCAQT